MTELDTGEHAGHEGHAEHGGHVEHHHAPQTGRRAHASRRHFMRKVFFASGATAVATMGGAGAG